MQELENVLPLLEAIVSYIDDGVMIASRDGSVLYMNPSACELLDVPKNKPIRQIGDVDSVDLLEVMETALNLQRSQQTQPFTPGTLLKTERRIPTNGGYRDLEFNCCMTCESENRLRLLMMRDVTQRKKLQTLLDHTKGDLVTNDPQMIQILHRLEHVAPQDAAVLLQGESGTGKTHIARLIHRLSRRAHGPLIEVNCAAIPEQLLESELFGHVKGAFTGATRDRQGRFLAADGGTLFLDEVGEIPLHLQAKLLRAIQDQVFEPVGSDKTIKVDVRIVSSSNRNLREMVDARKFRADLYYRLAVIPLYVPAVRERPGDIPLLLEYFCHNLESRGYPGDVQCSPEAMRMMMNYPWPGNVRELENAVEHAIICAVDKTVHPESLPQDVRNYSNADIHPDVLRRVESEREMRREIEDALRRARGNKSQAAQYLGIDRTTLWRRMQKLKVDDRAIKASLVRR